MNVKRIYTNKHSAQSGKYYKKDENKIIAIGDGFRFLIIETAPLSINIYIYSILHLIQGANNAHIVSQKLDFSYSFTSKNFTVTPPK